MRGKKQKIHLSYSSQAPLQVPSLSSTALRRPKRFTTCAWSPMRGGLVSSPPALCWGSWIRFGVESKPLERKSNHLEKKKRRKKESTQVHSDILTLQPQSRKSLGGIENSFLWLLYCCRQFVCSCRFLTWSFLLTTLKRRFWQQEDNVMRSFSCYFDPCFQQICLNVHSSTAFSTQRIVEYLYPFLPQPCLYNVCWMRFCIVALTNKWLSLEKMWSWGQQTVF